MSSTPSSEERARLLRQAENLKSRAQVLQTAGNMRSAIIQYLHLIPILSTVYGDDSTEACWAFNGMGECTLADGPDQRFDAAEEAFTQALKVRDDVKYGGLGLGTRAEVVLSRENMAKAKEGLGKFLEAREVRMRGSDQNTTYCVGFKEV